MLVIIGSKGRMGKMLLEHSTQAGLQVTGVDQPFETTDTASVCQQAKIVLFCVPVAVLPDILKQICPLLPADCIVADITSVKEKPLQAMEACWSGAVVGTHPLFGPLPDWTNDLPVAIIPGHNSGEKELSQVENFFSAMGMRVFRTTAKEHDKAMAYLQNLNFITNLAYFALLARKKELLPFLTPSFLRRMRAAEKMLTEDAEMFTGLFLANKYSSNVVRFFKRVLQIALNGKIEFLCNRVWWWWPKH